MSLALRHYLRQIWLERRVALPALLLPAVGNIFVFYAPPLVIAKLLGSISGGVKPTWPALVPYIAAFGGLWLLGELLWRLGIHFLNRLDARGIRRLYIDAMRYLVERDLAFFHDNFAGSLTKKTISYAKSFEGFVDTLAMPLLGNFLPLTVISVVLWRYSPWLIVALVSLVAVTITLIVPLIRRRRTLVVAREEAANEVAGHVADLITNMEAVRAFAREELETSVHRTKVDGYIARVLRSWDYQNQRISLATSPMYVLSNVTGLVLALATAPESGFNVEAVFVTFSYFATFTRVMWDFNHVYRNLEAHLAEASQFTDLLIEPSRVVDRPDATPFRPRDASVQLSRVRFRHHDRSDAQLFDDLDLSIASGEKVGLVGRSGGGKTTITRLLLRFMDVEAGRILVGGDDIARVRQTELRERIAYVPQDPMMFHRSIRDNIRFGRIEATDAEIREAARLAHAAEFIEALPNGYDTIVGERGVKLSGGQRQRVAIARAIVKQAPILVLDEATSSLDSESERLIQDALWTLMQGRTAIVIAHRLSTVQRMDRLVVLDRGRIIEQGTHAALLARRGVYAKLWSQQSDGFLVDTVSGSTAA
jgi:ATP-binding cassette, subfamily B, bacterial